MLDLVLDTNVVVDFLCGEASVLSFWRENVAGRHIGISLAARMVNPRCRSRICGT